MTEKLNRRQYLTLNWESTLSFLGNFLAPQIDLDRNFFRPPGANRELEFLTTCTRCGICKDVCPEQSIHLFDLASGVKLVNTPYLNPNESPCTFCLKCIDACPTGSLNLRDYREMPILGTAQALIDHCLASKQVMCDYCVRACPESNALTLENGVPVINSELCTGCGICVSHCISEIKSIRITLKGPH